MRPHDRVKIIGLAPGRGGISDAIGCVGVINYCTDPANPESPNTLFLVNFPRPLKLKDGPTILGGYFRLCDLEDIPYTECRDQILLAASLAAQKFAAEHSVLDAIYRGEVTIDEILLEFRAAILNNF